MNTSSSFFSTTVSICRLCNFFRKSYIIMLFTVFVELVVMMVTMSAVSKDWLKLEPQLGCLMSQAQSQYFYAWRGCLG